MLVPMKDILVDARKRGYGVVAPNVFSMETIAAVFEVSRELNTPMIIDCSSKFDLEGIAEITRHYARKYPEAVVALNLDHGRDFDVAVRAIRAGFSSVMVDRSQLPFEENVRETQEIVKIAHAVGVSVEAELGHVGQGSNYEEDASTALTDTDEAVKYVELTGVDCLAIAVGTAHGHYTSTPKIDFERLKDIYNHVGIPLVLHGGSSSGDENLRKSVEEGISKINIATDLYVNGAIKMKEYMSGKERPDFYAAVQHGKEGYKEMLKHYVELFGAVDKM